MSSSMKNSPNNSYKWLIRFQGRTLYDDAVKWSWKTEPVIFQAVLCFLQL